MSDIKLNALHDMDVTNQQMSLVEDVPGEPAAIAQEMRIGMQFHRGEWFLNTLVGIPFLQQVFVKNPSLAAINVLFTRAALSIPGALEMLEMSSVFTRAERDLATDYRVRVQDGGIIEGSVSNAPAVVLG